MTFVKNYSSILFKSMAILMLFVFIFTSCKKDKGVTSNESSIEGKWTGNKGYGNDVPTNDLLINIKTGGIIEETNTAGAVKGSGTWTLNGTNFTAQYKFKAPLHTVYTFKGTFNKSTGKINGHWGFDSADNEGNFYLNRSK